MVLVLPVAVVIAGSLLCGFMSRHREIMALNTSGISKQRAGFPVLLFGLLLSIIFLFLANLVVPLANSLKNELKTEMSARKGKHHRTIKKDILYRGEKGLIIFLHRYNSRYNKGEGAVVQRLIRDKIRTRYDAKRFYFLTDSLILEDGIKRVFLNGGAEQSQTDEGIYSFKRKSFYVEMATEILKGEKLSENLTTPELRERINKMTNWGLNPVRDKVDYWIRFFFSTFVLLLFVLPFSMRFRKYGFFIGFGEGGATAFIFYGFIRAAQTAGYNGVVSPVIASFLPTAIFLCAGLTFYLTQK